ncbi:MAG: hypothetical protein WEC35_02460 [Nitrosopumilaceae archaeon]
MKIIYVIVLICLAVQPSIAYGEEIFVTLGTNLDKIIFDGKWTFIQEWKGSSENVIKFDDEHAFSIRTAHDYENLYVFIDFITDTSIEKFSDRAILCLDSMANKSSVPDIDDYCFSISVGSTNPVVLQGGDKLGQTGFFKKIPTESNIITVGGISDTSDRYSNTPHTSYEFKIPVEIIGRHDVYGFYIMVIDAKTGNIYSWPQNVIGSSYQNIPSPDKWGLMISPDKSIPEFGFAPIWQLAIMMIIVFIISKIIFPFVSQIKSYNKL